MYLKNEKFLRSIIVIIFFLYSFDTSSTTNDKIKILNHIVSLENFSASFLQNDGEILSEGKIYIGKNRIRADYYFPTRILIVLDEDKAMYYNYELEEDEFFNPKNTNAWFIYEIFRNNLFFDNSLITEENKELILEKKGFNNEDKYFTIKLYFEKKPLVLRAVEVIYDDEFLKLSIFNHNYNEEFDENFFKLINPNFLN
tara:strand:+ start:953 stop:1549 length:597 start_codon:yes stop_codon:yes gene_type:complete